VGEDRDLRRQYRDGLREKQSESQVRSHFTQYLEYGRTVQRIV
jgi:cytochrome c-type biogenesis protein CcmH/NrfF